MTAGGQMDFSGHAPWELVSLFAIVALLLH